jgi:hypothetical protein
MRRAKCTRAVCVLLGSGVLFQFGGCLSSVWTQFGTGFGRALGSIPGAALSEAAFVAVEVGGSGG